MNPLAVDLTGSHVYNGTAAATSSILSVSNKVGGDDVTVSGSATLAAKDVGPEAITSFAGLTLGNNTAGDYTLTGATGSVTITPATLTASITNDPTTSYNGTITATLAPNNFSISGLVGGESFTVTQTAGMYNSPNVASATTVTASLTAGDFTAATGTLVSDYTLPTSASGSGSITAATVTIIVTPYTVTYDANPHTATGTATGVGGANLSNDLDLSGTTHTNAGTYNGDAWTFNDPTGNYRSASGTVTDIINQPATKPHPVIIGEQSLFLRKTNKKGRPVGRPVLTGFEFEFSSPLDPASATNAANYRVDNVTKKRVKKKVERILQPITKFNVSYSNDAVTIVLRVAWRSRLGARSRSSIIWRAPRAPHWQEPRCSRSPRAGRASRRRDRAYRVGLADDEGRLVRSQERKPGRTSIHSRLARSAQNLGRWSFRTRRRRVPDARQKAGV